MNFLFCEAMADQKHYLANTIQSCYFLPMNDNILDVWTSSTAVDTTYTVIPDGCRDLIMCKSTGHAPIWSVSPLFDQAKTISARASTEFIGFRMKPGVRFNEHGLLDSIKDQDINGIKSRLADFTRRQDNLEEILSCLSSDINSASNAAKHLGVSLRTLQRELIRETGRSPIYWILLARARKAARDMFDIISHAEIAYKYGYSDQAHLCREIKRWFNINPSKLKLSDEIFSQINSSGYS